MNAENLGALQYPKMAARLAAKRAAAAAGADEAGQQAAADAAARQASVDAARYPSSAAVDAKRADAEYLRNWHPTDIVQGIRGAAAYSRSPKLMAANPVLAYLRDGMREHGLTPAEVEFELRMGQIDSDKAVAWADKIHRNRLRAAVVAEMKGQRVGQRPGADSGDSMFSEKFRRELREHDEQVAARKAAAEAVDSSDIDYSVDAVGDDADE